MAEKVTDQQQQRLRTGYGKAGFRSLVTAIDMLGIRYSTRHNAMWGVEDASDLIASMSERSVVRTSKNGP